MSEETIRTKAITYTRDHLKELAAYAIAAASTVVSLSIAYGHTQANTEMKAKDFQDLKTEVQTMHSDLTHVKESQARIEGTISAIIPWAQGAAKFQAAVQQGAAEALAIPVPKGPQGHRAKHP